MNHLNEDMIKLINQQTLHRETAKFDEHYKDIKDIIYYYIDAYNK